MAKGSRHPGIERYDGKEGVRWKAKAQKRMPDGSRESWQETFSAEREALAARPKYLTSHDTGTNTLKTKVTVADALRHWLATHELGLAPTTLRGYRLLIEGHLLPAPIAALPLAKLNAKTIQG